MTGQMEPGVLVLAAPVYGIHVPGALVPAQEIGAPVPAQVPDGPVPAQVPDGPVPAQVPDGPVPAQAPGLLVPAQVPDGPVPAEVPVEQCMVPAWCVEAQQWCRAPCDK